MYRPLKVTVENKLRSFQFKLMQNIIPTNHSLYKMNIKASPGCERCLVPNETLIHMLCKCPDVNESSASLCDTKYREHEFELNPFPLF